MDLKLLVALQDTCHQCGTETKIWAFSIRDDNAVIHLCRQCVKRLTGRDPKRNMMGGYWSSVIIDEPVNLDSSVIYCKKESEDCFKTCTRICTPMKVRMENA